MSIYLNPSTTQISYQGKYGYTSSLELTDEEIKYLKLLAQKVADMSSHHRYSLKSCAWQKHENLLNKIPMVCCYGEGCAESLFYDKLKIGEPVFRKYESYLLYLIFHHRFIDDDFIIYPEIYYYDDVLSYKLHDIFGGILNIKKLPASDLCINPADELINKDGIEAFIYEMESDPLRLHNKLRAFTDSYIDRLKKLEKEEKLPYSTMSDYSVLGYRDYSYDLPHARKLSDMSGYGYDIRYSGITLQQYSEFILKYQAEILSLFRKNLYEYQNTEINISEVSEKIPSLHKIKIDSDCDIKKATQQAGQKTILSVSLNPSIIYKEDESEVEDYVLNILSDLQGTVSELRICNIVYHKGYEYNFIRIPRIIKKCIDKIYK